jgi:hypothetical protein
MKKALIVFSLLTLPFSALTFTEYSTVKEGNNAVSDTNRTTNQTLNNANSPQSTANRLTK